MTPHPLTVVIASVVVTALGQVALKIGTSAAGTGSAGTAAGATSVLALIGSSLSQPAVWLGLLLYGTGALLWLYVLARWDLSKAYPFVSLGFVLTFTIGVVFLGERFSLERLGGCLLICGGLLLIMRS
jgi:drug/metabolite transporter (DMT)-like permease